MGGGIGESGGGGGGGAIISPLCTAWPAVWYGEFMLTLPLAACDTGGAGGGPGA